MWLISAGLRCEWGASVLNLVLSFSLSYTVQWKFNKASHGKELSEDLKKRFVALHKDCVGYKKSAKTLKLICSTFNRTGFHSKQASPWSTSWVHILSVISRGCVWEIDIWEEVGRVPKNCTQVKVIVWIVTWVRVNYNLIKRNTLK